MTVELVEALQEQFPEKKLLISCAPTDRERSKMELLLKRIKRKPWRVHPGDLNLLQLAALIQQAALHLSGDTGPLHLAMMAGVPSVSWFRQGPAVKVWAPEGPNHRTLLGNGSESESLQGITSADVLGATKELSAVWSQIA